MLIPDNIVIQVKNTADLVDIVSEKVKLKRAGKNFVGLCPFHTEKTPSFTVNPGKRIFHCYGCGAGGDILSYVMQQEGFSFPEAVSYLAKRYGVDIPLKRLSADERKKIEDREALLRMNHQAMTFFHEQLFSKLNGSGIKYLRERELSEKAISDFKVGFVPDRWDLLTRFLGSSRLSSQLAEKAGLLIRKKNGGYYDRFRNRVIFPIFDISDHVIGFGGRVLDDSKPKYLNSPETIVFNKRCSLYGINRAKQAIRDSNSVYIVEGYIDVLALYQQGLENTVATLGTALSVEHVRNLKGHAQTFFLVFDSDNAGIKAAQRSVGIFAKEYVDARVIILPEGYDPDSYMRTYGKPAFLEQASKALKIMPFLIESAIKKYDLSVEGKVRIVNELKAPLANQEDVISRSLYIKELAERINIDEEAIQEAVRTVKHTGPWASNTLNQTRPGLKRSHQEVGTPPQEEHNNYRFEKRILTMMLQFPEIIDEVKQRNIVEYFKESIFKNIAGLIVAQYKKHNFQLSDLVACLPDTEKKRVITELATQEEQWDYTGCLKLLGQFVDSRKRSDNSLAKQIKAAEANKDDDLLMKLLEQKQHQARQMLSNNMGFSGGDFI